MSAVNQPQFAAWQPPPTVWKQYTAPPHELLQDKLGPNYPLLILSLIVSTAAANQTKYFKAVSAYTLEITAATVGGNIITYIAVNSEYFDQYPSPPEETYSVPTWSASYDRPLMQVARRQIPSRSVDRDELPPDEEPFVDPYDGIATPIIDAVEELLSLDQERMKRRLDGEIRRATGFAEQLSNAGKQESPDTDRWVQNALYGLLAANDTFEELKKELVDSEGPECPFEDPVGRGALANALTALEYGASVVESVCVTQKQIEQVANSLEAFSSACIERDYVLLPVYNDGTCTYQVMQIYLMLMNGECTLDQLRDPAWCRTRDDTQFFASGNNLEMGRIKVKVAQLQKELAAHSKLLAEESRLVGRKTWDKQLQAQMKNQWMLTIYANDTLRGYPTEWRNKLSSWKTKWQRAAREGGDVEAKQAAVTAEVKAFIKSEDDDKGWRFYVKMQAKPRYWGTEHDWFLFYDKYKIPVYQLSLDRGELISETAYVGLFAETVDGDAGVRFANYGNHYDLILRPEDIETSNAKYKEMHPETEAEGDSDDGNPVPLPVGGGIEPEEEPDPVDSND